MIEPRCLIRGDGSTGLFPGDFAELRKWFRQPGSQTRARLNAHRFEQAYEQPIIPQPVGLIAVLEVAERLRPATSFGLVSVGGV